MDRYRDGYETTCEADITNALLGGTEIFFVKDSDNSVALPGSCTRISVLDRYFLIATWHQLKTYQKMPDQAADVGFGFHDVRLDRGCFSRDCIVCSEHDFIIAEVFPETDLLAGTFWEVACQTDYSVDLFSGFIFAGIPAVGRNEIPLNERGLITGLPQSQTLYSFLGQKPWKSDGVRHISEVERTKEFVKIDYDGMSGGPAFGFFRVKDQLVFYWSGLVVRGASFDEIEFVDRNTILVVLLSAFFGAGS